MAGKSSLREAPPRFFLAREGGTQRWARSFRERRGVGVALAVSQDKGETKAAAKDDEERLSETALSGIVRELSDQIGTVRRR